MRKCRHKKGIVTAVAHQDVTFTPDQEPYESGKIESCGIDHIITTCILIGWCPICHKAKWIDVDDADWYSSND